MERLTRRIDGKVCLQRGIEWGGAATYKLQEDARERLAAYEDTELTPEEIIALKSIKSWADAVEREYLKFVNLEKDGRMVIIPCKPGQTVYYIGTKNCDNPMVFADTVLEVSVDVYIRTHDGLFSQDKIEKTVFLTHEEAEAALKEQEG